MTIYKFTERAYAKMIFHAAKYPHLAVNGVLLGSKDGGEIVDAIPLFHQCLYVTPMAEIALMQIDAFAQRENLVVAGYYAAPENFHDNCVERAPASKIADKIQENYKNACFVIIENKLMTLDQKSMAIKVFNCNNDCGRWSQVTALILKSNSTLQAVAALLQRGAMKEIIDFDNHLDNPENDWTNQFLNHDLQKILAMY
uniref:MPN domain-containing protein n=1 Tax=Glossina brevipalpis TaxID=37001 RepID=A0A1A9X1T9_9MUSC